MARRPGSTLGSLTPFGSGGVDFSAFNVLDPGQTAYLAFVKVQTAYEDGRATDAEYEAALEHYVNAQPANSADRITLGQRLDQFRYRMRRNQIVEKIDRGEATLADLVAFDTEGVGGLVEGSQGYRDRLDALHSSQAAWVADLEQEIVERYSDGQMTTAQLDAWYRNIAATPSLATNTDLLESLNGRIDDLADRLVDERDSRMIDDFSRGKVSTSAFLSYAVAARARYAAGTDQAREWDQRIDQARTQHAETDLLYRYGLSQQYAELKRFVQTNSSKPAGGTRTSKRTILGADGQWRTVETTTATPPTAAELKAYEELQVEIADAKRQMGEIASKIGGIPGGWATTDQVLGFYRREATKYTKGSADWFRVQGKIDDLIDRSHAETVAADQGIRITYPKVASQGAGEAADIDRFMRAIAQVESGGRYTARNAQTGAYGKYQILPQNWPAFAAKAGLPPDAEPTPENQEKVARAAMLSYFGTYGDWSRVAAAWHAGVAGTAKGPGQGNWGAKTTSYVNNVMGILGRAPLVSGGRVSQGYSSSHDGIDIAAKAGSPIYAVADGVVAYAANAERDANAGSQWAIGGGNVVNIDVGNGRTAQYAHMASFTVKPGQRVRKGQLIGYVGATGNATGPHLHFGLWDRNAGVMIDPYDFLEQTGGGLELDRIPGSFRVSPGSMGTPPSPVRGSASSSPGPAAPAASAAGGAANRKGPLAVVTSAGTLRRSGAEVVRTQPVGFPANLAGDAFRKFYAAYERAYESGAESFVDNSTGRAIAYWIGDDADERIERMRQLDDLRVRLHQEEVSAYAGTTSEDDAMDRLDAAVRDAAAHEYLILVTDSTGSTAPARTPNPIAAGVRLLDKQKTGIAEAVNLAQLAWKRGDITSAYSHLQRAQHMAVGNGTVRNIGQLAGYAEQALATIEQAYGGITPDEAGVAGKVDADLERLRSWQTELNELFAAGGDNSATGILSEIKKYVRTDAKGNPVWDEIDPRTGRPSDHAQLSLKDGVVWKLKRDGSLEIDEVPAAGWDPARPGRRARQVKNAVETQVRSGNRVVTAYADYEIGTAGWFVDAAGNRQPMMGKVVSYFDQDGREVTWVENPLNPGHWSSTPIAVRAPSTFKAVPTGRPNEYVYSFQVPGGDGSTFTLQPDPQTGVFVVYRSHPGGLTRSAVDMEPVGAAGDADVLAIFRDAGFSRDTSNLAGDDLAFSDMTDPIVGFTPRTWQDFQRAFRPPALAGGRGGLGRNPNADLASLDRRFWGEPAKGPPLRINAPGRDNRSAVARVGATRDWLADELRGVDRGPLGPAAPGHSRGGSFGPDPVAPVRPKLPPLAPPRVAPRQPGEAAALPVARRTPEAARREADVTRRIVRRLPPPPAPAPVKPPARAPLPTRTTSRTAGRIQS